jgi:hypothetical protein
MNAIAYCFYRTFKKRKKFINFMASIKNFEKVRQRNSLSGKKTFNLKADVAKLIVNVLLSMKIKRE